VVRKSREVRGLEDKTFRAIRKHNMLKKGDKVLIAVSGGPDSVALLYFLYSILEDYRLDLHVFHLDHKIRGKSSSKDAVFVEKLAEKMDLPISSLNYDVTGYIRDKNLSLQEGARKIRYQLMDQVCNEIGAERIAIGHNADDQVETFLMRIIRGTGPAGLKGIPPVRGKIIRPLIEVRRKEIEDYLEENQIEYCLDESNLKLDYTRNWVRHKVVPLLMQQNEKLQENLQNTIALVSDEEIYLDRIADDELGRIADYGENTVSVKHDELAELPMAIQRRIIRKIIERVKGDLKEIEFKHIETILSRREARGSVRTDLPGEVVAINEYGNLVFGLSEELGAKAESNVERIELNIPGVTSVPSLGIAIDAKIKDIKGVSGVTEKNKEKAFIDFDKLNPPLIARTRLPGDRFIPLGMSGEKKLQDFFVDKKVPKRKRDKIAIVECQGQVVWIGEMIIDDRLKVTSNTEKVLILEVK